MDQGKNLLNWAFLFPGQGAQYPGMGCDFVDAFSVAKRTFEEADDLLQESFSRLILEGPSTELTLTKNSQVAIFVVSTAILRTVQEQFPTLYPSVCAGLSLGEYTALMASGRISFKDCLELVRIRASAMHAACEIKKGTMQVVLGLSEEAVASTLQSLPSGSELWIANLNCPEQVVIAGTEEMIAAATPLLKEQGAKRLLPLDVSGAFHSGLMRPAQEKLDPEITRVHLTESSTELVMNVPGDFVRDLSDIRRYLIEQVVSPVRWEKGIRAMQAHSIPNVLEKLVFDKKAAQIHASERATIVRAQGASSEARIYCEADAVKNPFFNHVRYIDVYLEMGPGKSLSGMNKRIGVSAPTLSIEKVSDLEQLVKYVEAYAVTKC